MAKPVLGKSVRSDWFFLGWDFAVRSKPCSFVLEQSRQIQNLQPKQRKKNVNIVILHSETTRKAKKTEFLLRFQRWMKKTNIFRARSGLIWCRKWNGHRRKPWGQRRFYQPTENFYTTLRSPSKRISVKRSVTFFHLSSSKHRIHQQVHIPNILW